MTNIPDPETLLRVGLAVANRWHVPPNANIVCVPEKMNIYYLPVYTVHDEQIVLEHFKTRSSGLWIGYGPRTNTLVFHYETPARFG